MADKNFKVPENVHGKFYLDNSCVDCDLCREMAPQFFKRFDEGGYTYVWRQPNSPDEIKLAEEAKNSCPTESIGNDGD
jgi:ferredoxin